MIKKLSLIWEKHGFMIVFISSIVFILIVALFRRGKKGTWNKFFYYGSKGRKRRIEGHDSPDVIIPKKESSGEKECRRVLENLFRKKFPNHRPDFLNNPVTGGIHNLEIDCYNAELNLGVEYQGSQHYNFNKFFHRNYDAFQNQKYRDELKRHMCKDNGVVLIEVPYTVKKENIEKYLRDELERRGFSRYFL